MYKRFSQNFLSEFSDVEGTIQIYDRVPCALVLVLGNIAFDISAKKVLRVSMVGGIFTVAISKVVKETLMEMRLFEKNLFFARKNKAKEDFYSVLRK